VVAFEIDDILDINAIRRGDLGERVTEMQRQRMKALTKVLGIVMVVAILACTSFGAAARPTQAATGGINIDAWCKALYMGQSRAALVANNVCGWRCQYYWYGLKLSSIDLNSACRWQYNRSWATEAVM